MQYEYLFLFSLFLTLIIEIPILFLIVKYIFKIKVKNSLLLFSGFFASFATLPYIWFIFPLFLKTYFSYTILGELIVFLLESIILYFMLNLNIKKALIASFICNFISFTLGLIIQKFI